MANATRYVGWSLGAKVDFSDVERMNRMVDVLGGKLEKVDNRFSGMKMPDNVSRGVQRADDVTASYIRRLESAGKTYEADQEKVKLYDHQIETLTQHQKDLESALGKVANKSGTASDAYAKQKIAINDTATSINRLKSGLNSTQSEMSDLRAKGLDRTAASTSRLRTGWGKLKNAGSELANVGSAISAAMVPVAGAFMEANKQAIKLANEYNVIKNLQQTGGDSASVARRTTNRIERANRRLSLKYGVDQNELAAGTEELIRRGYTGNQDLAAHKYFLQAARASGETYNTVVAAGAPMLEQFGYKARAGNSSRRMAKYTRDVLNKAAYVADLTAGNIGGENGFGEAFKMMGSIAHQNNQSIDTMLGALGTLSNYGQKGSMAGTGMRQIISRLIGASSSKTRTAALADLHMKPSDLFTRSGRMKPLTQIFAELNRHTRGMKQSEVSNDMQQLFGQTGFNDAQILMRNYRNFQQNVHDSRNAARTNYIQHLSGKNMKSLQNQLARTREIAKDMGQNFAKEVAPGIAKAVGWANKLLNAFNHMPKPLKQATAYITAAVGAVGASKLASGFLKANFGIGNGKGLGGIAGQLLLGTKVKGSARTGGLAGLLRNGANGRLFGGNYLGRSLKTVRAAGGFGNLTRLGQVATVGAYGGSAIAGGVGLVKAFQDRHSASKRSADIGSGLGAAIGGGLATAFLGPEMAPVGIAIGKAAGGWGGKAVNSFTKGWQSKKPPKNFWSLQNLGWSMHSMAQEANDRFNSAMKPVGRSWNRFWGARGNDIKHGWHGMSTWIGKASSNIGRAAQRGWKGTTSFFKNLPSNAHKGWNKAMAAGHNFFREMPKRISAFGRTVANNRYVKAFRQGHLFQTAFHDMHSRWNAFSKWYGHNWNAFWKQTNKTARADWNGTKRNWNAFWTSLPKNWNRFKTNFGKGWNRFWGDIKSFFVTTWKDIKKVWDSTIGAISKGISKIQGFFGGIGKWFGQAKGRLDKTRSENAKAQAYANAKTANNQRAFMNDIAFFFGHSHHTFKYEKVPKAPAHAKGTASLVGEAGPELAYRPWANSARILGANGPQLARVHSGEKILNARDTAKVMAGGLGKGLVLKGYASGTAQLGKTAKTVTGSYKKITDQSSRQLDKLNKHNKSTWSSVKSSATKQVTSLQHSNNSTWGKITSQTNKQTDKTRKNSIADYTNMRKGIDKQMDAMHTGVINTAESTAKGFGKAMGKMDNYAHSAMSNTMKQLNKGINGIDKVISEFGGNGDAIKTVHFANGSNGALNSNMLGIVNDATSGPRQESIIRGNNVIVPNGHDRIFPLQKNDRVLNGRQTLGLAHHMGYAHFAKGSGVSHAELKRLYHLAEHNWKNPEQTGKEMFSPVTGLQAGSKVLANDAEKTGEKQGLKYWGTLWSLAQKKADNDSGSLGPASGLLKAVEHYGEGHRYVRGAAGPTTFDCSGLVMYALKHAYGIDYPHFSGSQYSRTEHISKSQARMGDLVFWGAGGDEHVGVYAGGNKYFSAESPSQGIHMNTLSSVVDKGRPLFGRVRGANTHGHAKIKDSVKTSGRLERFVKQSVGSGFWHTMSKISDEFSDGGSMANPAGDSVSRWKPAVIKALRANGFSASPFQVRAWMRVIQRESNGNPHAVNNCDSNAKAGIPSKGLVQTIEPTFNAYKKRGHGNIFNGYDDLLAGINYMAHKYGRGSSAFARVSGPEGYAKGGHAHGTVLVGEQGPELLHLGQDAKIDSFPTTKKKLTKLADILKPIKATVPKLGSKSIGAPHITININGPISSSHEAKVVGDQIQQKIVQVFEQLGDDLGTDPSVY